MILPTESQGFVTAPDTGRHHSAVTVSTDGLGTVHVTHGPFRATKVGGVRGFLRPPSIHQVLGPCTSWASAYTFV